VLNDASAPSSLAHAAIVSLQLAAVVYEHPNEAIREAVKIASHKTPRKKLNEIVNLIGTAAAQLPGLPKNEEDENLVCFTPHVCSDFTLTRS
jgi:hypothetical protein